MKSNVVAALAEFNEEAQNQVAEGAQSKTRQNPLPDPGAYDIVMLPDEDGYDAFPYTDKKSEITYINVVVNFRIVGGPKDGLRVDKTFWGNSEWDTAALFDVVTLLSGVKPTSTRQAVELLSTCGGRQIKMTITEKTKDNVTRKYMNFAA